MICGAYTLKTNNVKRVDPAARIAVASALRAISVRASNQFADGGSNDIWIKHVLPIAFIGRHDKEAGLLFEEVWNEGGQVANMTSNDSFAMQLQEKILPFLTRNFVDALNDVSWDRRLMACVTLDELCKSNILAPAPRSLNHDTFAQQDWDQRDFVRSSSSRIILTTCVNLVVNTRMWLGKSNLIKTTVSIAANWISTSIPIKAPVIKNVFHWDDLFEGDSWFVKNKIDNCGTIDATFDSSKSKKEKEGNQDSDIDFSEGDKILSNEDDHEVIETMETSPSQRDLTLSGLCRVILIQGVQCVMNMKNAQFYSDDALSYRAASLQSLAQLLRYLDSSNHLDQLFQKMAPNLIPMVSGHVDLFPEEHEERHDQSIPPLMVARVIDCLGFLIWDGMQFDSSHIYTNIELLVKLFSKNCDESQRAWTIREASALALSNLCRKVHYNELLKKIDVLDNLVISAKLCPNDKKFWKVRYAKALILKSLCNRVEKNGTNENQLILEALLPIKEPIVAIAKSNLSDSEAAVTAVSSEILAALAWWP